MRFAIGLALAAAACAPAPPADFSTAAARAHLDQLAGVIGPRPAGTDANADARAYIIQALENAGFDVRVQDTEARRPEIGLAGRVRNVIGLLPGQRPDAIGIVAHYDSVPESPGGGDNALGVASALEAARVLASHGTRRWSVYVLLTDSEESGLLGATALLDDPEVAARLKTVVNLDSMGADAPVVLFEAGPGNSWLTGVWARAAPIPRGASYFYEIYRRMPNDTDFSVFRRAGIPGLNLAAVGDSYAYHSRLDRATRVTDAAIRGAGATTLAVVEALEREDITRRTSDEASYTDLGGLAALSWGPRVDLVLAVLAVVLGVVALVRCAANLCRRGAGAPIVALLWTVIGGSLVLAAMTGAVSTLRAVREVYHPWYAHPERLLVLLVTMAAASVAVLARMSAILPKAWRPARAPGAVWLPALTVWVALTAAAGWGVPRVTFLCALPLLAAAGPIAAFGLRPAAARTAALASAAVTLVLFPRDAVLFFSFLTALLGLAGVLVPVWVYPALTAGFAIFLAPPLVALAVELPPRFTRALLWPLAALAVASFAWAFMATAYTPARPLRASMAQVVTPDGDGHVALASAEPLFAIGAGTPSLVPGRSDVPELRFAVRGAFSVSGRMAPPGPAGSVSARTSGSDAAVVVELDILADAPGTSAAVLLPHGVSPRDSSLPGIAVAGRWRTRYVGIPAEGLTLRLTLDPADLARLDEARVWLQPPIGTAPSPGDAAAWWHLPGVAWDVLVRHELPLR